MCTEEVSHSLLVQHLGSCDSAAQVYVSIHDGHRTKAWRIHLAKGTRSRLQEDVVASRLVRPMITALPHCRRSLATPQDP